MSSPAASAGGAGFVGVWQRGARWVAAIEISGRTERLGVFDTAEEAARAYDCRAVEARGAATRVNFPTVPEVPPGAAAIQLSRGLWALVDAEDYAALNAVRWTAKRAFNTWYARRRLPDNTSEYMHQRLAGGAEVDHGNGNGLDNRRSNLRPCTHALNCRNQRRASTPSGYKGVSRASDDSAWRATIALNGRQRALGRFTSAYDAALAYDDAAHRLHGEFACPNGLHGPRPARRRCAHRRAEYRGPTTWEPTAVELHTRTVGLLRLRVTARGEWGIDAGSATVAAGTAGNMDAAKQAAEKAANDLVNAARVDLGGIRARSR